MEQFWCWKCLCPWASCALFKWSSMSWPSWCALPLGHLCFKFSFSSFHILMRVRWRVWSSVLDFIWLWSSNQMHISEPDGFWFRDLNHNALCSGDGAGGGELLGRAAVSGGRAKTCKQHLHPLCGGRRHVQRGSQGSWHAAWEDQVTILWFSLQRCALFFHSLVRLFLFLTSWRNYAGFFFFHILKQFWCW